MSDSDIAQFCELTGATHQVAEQFLSGSDLESAITTYYAAQEASEPADAHAPQADAFGTPPGQGQDDDEEFDDDEDDEQMPLAGSRSAAPPAPTGTGYTLSGQPIAVSADGFGTGSGSSTPRVGRVGQWGGAGPSARTAAGGSGPRIATLGGTGRQAAEDSDEDEEERRKNPDLYAGGEKSGLAVQNPNKQPGGGATGRDVVDKILEQAKKGGVAPGPGESSKPKKSTAFTGGGMTLGSDDVPSQAVGVAPSRPAQAGPSRGAPGMLGNLFGGLAGMAGFGGQQQQPQEDENDSEEEETQVRNLTFWRDGFSVEDGDLMRYDVPGNQEILRAIQSGHAPPSVLDVKIGQPVEVRVARRVTEDYVRQPPRPRGPFEGAGNRLGAPSPAASSSAPAPGAAGANVGMPTQEFVVDNNEPVTSVQVRLADGTKIVVKVNLTHTVGDIRNLVTAAAPGGRPFTLQTTFPTKVLDDNAQTIADAKLQNAVVVQRWA